MGLRRVPPSTAVILATITCLSGQTGDADKRVLDAFRDRATDCLRQGLPSKAAEEYRKGGEVAKAGGQSERAALFFNAAGAAHLRAGQPRAALEDFKRSESLAIHLQRQDLPIALASNQASLYLGLGDLDAASIKIADAKQRARGLPRFLAPLLTTEARIRLRQGRHAEAAALFSQAIDLTDSGPDWDLRTLLLADLGDWTAAERRNAQALSYFEEAHRIRAIHGKGDGDRILRRLADLYLALGNLTQAECMSRRSVQLSINGGQPEGRWRALLTHGRVLRALGRRDEALLTYREALKFASRWRSLVVPNVNALIESDVTVADLTAAYCDLTAELAVEREDQSLAEESLMVVSQQRAASLLRLARMDETQGGLGADYGDLVRRLRAMDMSMAPMTGREAKERRDRLELELKEKEFQVFPPLRLAMGINGGAFIRQLKAALEPRHAALGFQLGLERSWRWTVTREGLQIRALPGRKQIEPEIAKLRETVAQPRDKDPRRALERVADLLLAGLPRAASEAPHWWISVEGDLAEIPWAALRLRPAPDAPLTFLVQQRSLEFVPTLAALLVKEQGWRPGKLAAAADAIYNRADPRSVWNAPRGWFPFALQQWTSGSAASSSPVELARLAGSRVEVEMVARRWKSAGLPVQMVLGEAVNATRIQQLIEGNPSVIHLAAHLEESGGSSSTPPSIRLSLRPDGQPDALTAQALMRLRLPGSIVTMSGCSSGRGRPRGGEGVAGLTKAWLLGGASHIVASLWPVSDGTAVLFDDFYEALLDRSSPSSALRLAQLRLIERGGWGAHPSVWSAWTITGKLQERYVKF